MKVGLPTVAICFPRLAKVRVVTAQVVAKLRSDARDNRWRIVAAARAALAAGGDDVTMREIARRADVGPATVYRHFPTKHALLAEARTTQMAMCSAVVADGLAASDPWSGFRQVLDALMETPAGERGLHRAVAAQLPGSADFAAEFAADREHAVSLLLELVRRAKDAGSLRADFVLEDLALALMANDGIRAESAELRLAASRRFAALMIQSFQADPISTPLPPPVRLALTRQ